MARKTVLFKKSTLRFQGSPNTEGGYTAIVYDNLSGEELFNQSSWGSSGGLAPLGSAVSLWKEITRKFGDDLDVDNSEVPFMTKEFITNAVNPKEYFAVIKNWFGFICLEIHTGNKEVPLYKYDYKEGIYMQRNEIISSIKSRIERYKIRNIDCSEAPSFIRVIF